MNEDKLKNANVFVGVLTVIIVVLLFLLFSNSYVLELIKTILIDTNSAAAHRADAIYWGLPAYLVSLLLGFVILFVILFILYPESNWLVMLLFISWLILYSPIYWGFWFNLLKSMGFTWAQAY